MHVDLLIGVEGLWEEIPSCEEMSIVKKRRT